MTLKKLIFGQPGNINEFVKMVKERDLPVTILFHVYREKSFTGLPIMHGSVIYSGGSFEQTIARGNVKLVEWWGNTESKEGSFNVDGILNFLRDKSAPNLEYLTSQDIKYEVKTLNEIYC
jgi:hypothetical protein